MNLTWFSIPNTALAENLIEHSTTIRADYMSGEENTAYEQMWVSNQGTETSGSTLVDLGFYVEADELYYFNLLLNYASLLEDGKPCGLFIVYGYTDDTGATSYIDSFLAGDLSPEQMQKFQINWTQGINPLNAIKMSGVFTYDSNGEYNQRSNLELKGGSENAQSENKGTLRIAVILRIPRGENPKALSFASQIRLNAHALKEIYDT